MGFNRSEQIEDWSRSLRPTNKVPKKVSHAEGSSSVFGPDQNKNPSQKKSRGIPTSVKKQSTKLNTRNNVQQKKEKEMPFDGKSGSGGEKHSEGKKTKYPTKINSVPKAKQKRQPIGRNKD